MPIGTQVRYQRMRLSGSDRIERLVNQHVSEPVGIRKELNMSIGQQTCVETLTKLGVEFLWDEIGRLLEFLEKVW